MLRLLLISISLLFALPVQAVFAQDGEDKPTEILPDKDELWSDMPTQKVPAIPIGPPIIAIEADEDMTSDTINGSFVIGAVLVEGSDILPQSAFNDVIEPFVGKLSSFEDLQALTKAVANRARSEGLLFAAAFIPAQSVNMGIVRVRLDDGTIDEVKVQGTNNRLIARVLKRLEGRPGHRSEVEGAILTVEDLYGISVTKTTFLRSHGKRILKVKISQLQRYQANATFDNYGRNGLGAVRGRVQMETRGFTDGRDRFQIEALTVPQKASELAFISTRYSNILSDDGKVFSITGGAGKTRRRDDRGGFEATSRSRYAGMQLSAPIVRSTEANIWANVDAELLSVDRQFVASQPRHDDISSMTASINGNTPFAGGRLSGGVAVTQGLDILGATRLNDPAASRDDASGKFTKGEFWVNWTRKLDAGFSLRTMVKGQIASRPLLSPQEIDLGGPRTGRGFDYAERSGDQGVAGSVELRRYVSKPFGGTSWAQAYVFADGGFIDNFGNGRGGGSLMSAGAGVRGGTGKVDIAFEVAVPVHGMRDNRKSPRFNLALSFAL